MRAKTIILGVTALAAAFGAASLARDWLQNQQTALQAQLDAASQQVPEPQPVDMVRVLVANQNLPAGAFVKMEELRWADWPEASLAETYFLESEMLESQSNAQSNGEEDPKYILEGAVIRSGLTAGEPLTEGRVIRPGERGFLAAVLNPGNRAVSVPINATTGISGFVFPGDQVDLLLTQSVKQGDITRRATETVLRDIRVLAVDQRVSDQEGKAEIGKTATLEVSPEQAELVAVAMEMGRLSLALRSLPQETLAGEEITEPGEATLTWDREASRVVRATLWSTSRSQSPKKPSGPQVKIIRGGEEQTIAFGSTN